MVFLSDLMIKYILCSTFVHAQIEIDIDTETPPPKKKQPQTNKHAFVLTLSTII